MGINREVTITIKTNYSFTNGSTLPDALLEAVASDMEDADAFSVTIEDPVRGPEVWKYDEGEWTDPDGEPYELYSEYDEDDDE